MIEELVENKKDDQRLLRHIIKCYLKLSENSKFFIIIFYLKLFILIIIIY